jgi:hypothetical protein
MSCCILDEVSHTIILEDCAAAAMNVDPKAVS